MLATGYSLATPRMLRLLRGAPVARLTAMTSARFSDSNLLQPPSPWLPVYPSILACCEPVAVIFSALHLPCGGVWQAVSTTAASNTGMKQLCCLDFCFRYDQERDISLQSSFLHAIRTLITGACGRLYCDTVYYVQPSPKELKLPDMLVIKSGNLYGQR